MGGAACRSSYPCAGNAVEVLRQAAELVGKEDRLSGISFGSRRM